MTPQEADGIEFAQGGLGVDVTVAHRGHGDDGPPEGLGDALKQGLWVALLHGVAQGREDECLTPSLEQQPQFLEAAA